MPDGHAPGCFGTHVAEISCADVTKARWFEAAHRALWDCPNSASRGQPAHEFPHGERHPETRCVRCGMTWGRLAEDLAAREAGDENGLIDLIRTDWEAS